MAETGVPRTKITSTVIRETLPSSESQRQGPAKEYYDREMWEVMAAITMDKLWDTHLVRVYRTDEHGERPSSPEGNVFQDSFNEETLRGKWGGGHYTIWLYGPPSRSQVRGKWQISLEGPASTPFSKAGAPVSSDPNTAVAMQALQMMNNPEMMRMMMQMYVTASTEAMQIIKAQIPQQQNPLETLRAAKEILGGGNGGGLVDRLVEPLLLALIPALISKFTNPADPLQDFEKIAASIKTVAGSLGMGAPAGKVDVMSTLVSNLPAVVEKAMTGIRDWRLGQEAQLSAVKLAQGTRTIDMPAVESSSSPTNTAGDASAPASPAPAAPASPVAPPAPAAQVIELTPEVRQEVVMQHILGTVVDTINNKPEATGEDLYEYLSVNVPAMVDQLKGKTREEIVGLFRMTPILQTVADHPRLPKMIDEFLAAAKLNAAP